MVRVVVLLGPPGSGKSTIGAELGRLGLRWREWEPWLLQQWGSRQNFAQHKAEALASLHAEIREFIDAGPPAAVIESTGISDRDFIDALQAGSGYFVARLDVSEDAALERVRQRAQGEHLNDDVEANRAVWRAFQSLVSPVRGVDLVIDTEKVSAREAARLIYTSASKP